MIKKENLEELDSTYGIISIIINSHKKHEIKNVDTMLSIEEMLDEAIKSSDNFKEAAAEIISTYPHYIKFLVSLVKKNYPDKLQELEKMMVLV